MVRRNYFVEGLQGSGKSTLVQRLSKELQGYKVFREGDYSPVELAWCAYVTKGQYQSILKHYPSLAAEIQEKATEEGDHHIICYTQILTDIPGFHKELEKFEIYNGNLGKEAFEDIILERFRKWEGEGQIFECSIFQNIIENQMLYLQMEEEEILGFYRRLKDVLAARPYKIIYLDMDNIADGIAIIKKERSDENGNELWFPLMVRYIEESPYGREHAMKGLGGLLAHLERRKALERKILREVFEENAVVVKAKSDMRKDMEGLLMA